MGGMNQQQMQMMRMRMQQQGMMRSGEPMPNMMPNGSGMEMMGPNGMMMRGGLGPGGPQAGMMGGMGPRQPGMMQGNGGMMGPGINMAGGPGMLGPGHPAMQHHGMQASRPPPPEYGMSSQVSPALQSKLATRAKQVKPANLIGDKLDFGLLKRRIKKKSTDDFRSFWTGTKLI